MGKFTERPRKNEKKISAQPVPIVKDEENQTILLTPSCKLWTKNFFNSSQLSTTLLQRRTVQQLPSFMDMTNKI